MRRFTSMQSRLFASLVAAALAVAPFQTVLGAPSVEELYSQGQEKFDASEFGEAGDLWGEAVQLLPEDKNNSATRQTIMNLALDAYLRAYRETDDRKYVDAAKKLLDDYEASLEGSGTELSSEIAGSKGKVDDILTELAEAEAAAAATGQEDEGGDDDDGGGDDSSAVIPDGPPPKPGKPLVITGAALMGVGGVGIGLLLGGVIGSLSAQTQYDAADPGSAERDTAEKKGKAMNGLAIAGGVIAPVFLGTGVALLIVGLRKNKAARDGYVLAPSIGPSFTGLSLTGRFLASPRAASPPTRTCACARPRPWAARSSPSTARRATSTCSASVGRRGSSWVGSRRSTTPAQPGCAPTSSTPRSRSRPPAGACR
jgi:hypothetical protein